ncbi:hypothetical protein O181_031411 [Austropuccinia psidii MF-1]|uniref:Protein arginine N-methyltransferase n=1 Tax=Austropuccinia psidii MF-1 TaxID=1389203 RepID=A0A9Q3H562_9BASI|nr:hypothetical protein [Austropuccinia psidii MF-1]
MQFRLLDGTEFEKDNWAYNGAASMKTAAWFAWKSHGSKPWTQDFLEDDDGPNVGVAGYDPVSLAGPWIVTARADIRSTGIDWVCVIPSRPHCRDRHQRQKTCPSGSERSGGAKSAGSQPSKGSRKSSLPLTDFSHRTLIDRFKMSSVAAEGGLSQANSPAPVGFPPSAPYWMQSSFDQQQRTPIILGLSQCELDAFVSNPQQSFQNPNPSPAPSIITTYGPQPQALPLEFLLHTHLNDTNSEYDALSIPLTNSEWRSRWESLCLDQPSDQSQPQPQAPDNAHEAEHWRRNGCFMSSEVNLHSSFQANKFICMAAEWLELDSAVEGIRFDCELALKQELSYATYINLSHLIIPMIRNRRYIADYARAISSLLNGLSSSVILSIVIPILDPEKALLAWEDWHSLRRLCGSHPRLNTTLELAGFAGFDVTALIGKWAAEPVGFISIPATAFISNAKQYPVLTKSCQTFLKAMFKYKPSIILSQTLSGRHSSGGALAYVQYIRFLERKVFETPLDPIESFAADYVDYLQAPLQPLADNLESQVYEGFEKDPVKYSKYELAIFQALSQRSANVTHVIAVCGAGRGPLVQAALRAARRAGRSISVTAIEKNPNSYLTLQERLRTEWNPKIVQLWFGDMRDYQPSEPIDILVSELLGSFGDNELSPECLDGVIRWLAADGLSIPSSYCSFVAPLSSNKIYSKVTEFGKFQTPFVVMIHAAQIISGTTGAHEDVNRVQEAWSFDHPRTDLIFSPDTGVPITNFHNSRSSHLTFYIPQASVCHGFAGYFRATLYGSVVIETHPDFKMSREMLSWFPMFFPFKEPIYCPKDSELDIHLWRLTDHVGRKVWYEWSAEAFKVDYQKKIKSIPTIPRNTDPALLEEFMESEENGLRGNSPHEEDYRTKIAVSSLHNVLGKESNVKW